MTRLKPFTADETAIPDLSSDSDANVVLIDDSLFVTAFAEAGQRRGKMLVCICCLDPTHALRAVLLLLDKLTTADASAGGLGLCCVCYRDLTELLFHDAVLRASKPMDR